MTSSTVGADRSRHSEQVPPPETLGRRIGLTYVGMLTWPLAGVGLAILLGWGILVGANSLAAIGPALVVAVIVALVGWGAGMWHCARLGLGTVTASAAGLWPVVAVALAAPLQSWWPILLVGVVTPVVVALVAHGRRRAAAVGGGVAAGVVGALVAATVLGWGPFATGLSDDRLVDALQTRDLEVFAPPPSSGLSMTDVELTEDGVTYAVEDGELTHTVRLTRYLPRAGKPGPRSGPGTKYMEGTQITVVSQDATGALDRTAAAAFVERLQWSSHRSFAREV